MLHIAILGCGQIGSRHLQSLALLDERAEIHLVDPSRESLFTARERFAQVVSSDKRGDFRIVSHDSANSLPAALDVAIIASGSLQRASLCECLLAVSKPRYLILEKFLFPRVADFARIENLLLGRQIPTYVNQWMATTDAFRQIARRFAGSRLRMRVSGRGWGLCCNAVHYIEPFQYLTGRTPLRLVNADFQDGWQDSKRSGYREIFGTLTFLESHGSSLELSCAPGAPETSIHIQIANNRLTARIEFFMDRFECKFNEGGPTQTITLPLPMQSQLTHLLVQSLLRTGRCDLPDFATSSIQHLLVLNPFLDHFRRFDHSIREICPIT